MTVADCMITPVHTIHPEATLRDVVQTMTNHRVGTLPVVDDDHHLVGMVLLDDVLVQFMPNVIDMLRSADFIHDYGFLEQGHIHPGQADRSIKTIMRAPYSVQSSSSLMEALVLMHKHQVDELPVLDEQKKVVGIVSRQRVGTLFLSNWLRRSSTPPPA